LEPTIDPTEYPSVDPTADPTTDPTFGGLSEAALRRAVEAALSDFAPQNLAITTKLVDTDGIIDIEQAVAFKAKILTEDSKGQIERDLMIEYAALITGFDQSLFSLVFGAPPRRRLLQIGEYLMTVKYGESASQVWGPNGGDDSDVNDGAAVGVTQGEGGGLLGGTNSVYGLLAISAIVFLLVCACAVFACQKMRRKEQKLRAQSSVNNLEMSQKMDYPMEDAQSPPVGPVVPVEGTATKVHVKHANGGHHGNSMAMPSIDFGGMNDIANAETQMPDANVFKHNFGGVAPIRRMDVF